MPSVNVATNALEAILWIERNRHLLDSTAIAITSKADLIDGEVPFEQLSPIVASDSPPEGYKEVTKIYVNLETGLLLVEHKL